MTRQPLELGQGHPHLTVTPRFERARPAQGSTTLDASCHRGPDFSIWIVHDTTLLGSGQGCGFVPLPYVGCDMSPDLVGSKGWGIDKPILCLPLVFLTVAT